LRFRLGTSHGFRRIVDVATSSGYEPVGKDKLYILDLSAVYVVDASTLTLRGLVQLNESDVVTGLPRHPLSVQVDPATGHVIISDSDSNTVEEYNPDSGRLTRCLIRIGLENGLPAPGACGHMTVVPTRPTGGFGGFRISLLHLLFCGPGLAEVRMYRV
jgi:DNA-binding beta-propeller fold protein YncE